MLLQPVHIGPPMPIAVFLKPVRAGFPSPADDYLDAPIDLSRTLITNAPATFIMTVAGDSAPDACNSRHGRGAVFTAASGVERQRRKWITKFEMRSPRYTTRIDELPVVGRA